MCECVVVGLHCLIQFSEASTEICEPTTRLRDTENEGIKKGLAQCCLKCNLFYETGLKMISNPFK